MSNCSNLLKLLLNASMFTILISCTNKNADQEFPGNIQNGDIIFQISKSEQSKAIQLATHSKYSHMGILYCEGNKWFVFEAVQPVKLTPLKKWINRGRKSHFVVKRLKNSDKILSTDILKKMKIIGEKHLGKSYDLHFQWSDNKMYCSELVWKIYYRAIGIKIGQRQTLKEFDLSHKLVKNKMKHP